MPPYRARRRALAIAALLTLLLLTAFASISLPASAGDASLFDPSAWVPDGPVYAIESDPASGRIYLGGDFDSINPYTGHLLALDRQNAQTPPPVAFPVLDGPVYAIAGDAANGWFIGGAFQSANGLPRKNLARLNPDLSLDAAWAPEVDGPVYAIQIYAPLSGTIIYAGGAFQSVNGQPRANLAALDKSGSLLPWTPNPDGPVHALLVAPTASTLYIGGAFHHLGGQANNAFGSVGLKGAGASTGWAPSPALDDQAEVDALAMVSTYAGPNAYNILVGGRFTIPLANGSQRHYLASYSAYGVLNEGVDFNVDGPVRSLLFATRGLDGYAQSNIYASGDFSHIAGYPIAGLARIVMADQSIMVDLAYNFQLDGPVYAILQINGSLPFNQSEQVIAGAFQHVRGKEQVGLFRTIYNAKTAQFDVLSWSPGIQYRNGAVRAVVNAGGRVLAGGEFFSAGGQRQANLGALDSAGQAIPGWDAGTDGPVRALALADGKLFFGGQFATITGQGSSMACSNAGAAEADTGALADWRPNPDGAVYALAARTDAAGAALAMGGAFQTINDPGAGSIARPRLALVRAADGQIASLNLAPDQPVRALAVQENVLFAGGAFTYIGGVAYPYAAGIDLTGSHAPYPLLPAAPVTALAVSGSRIYLAEEPPEPGDGPLQGRLEVFDWQSPGSPLGETAAFRGWLPALEAGEQLIFLGGAVPSGPTSAPFLAALDPQSKRMPEIAKLLPWPGEVVSAVRAIHASGERLLVGGDFRGEGSRERPYFLIMAQPTILPTAEPTTQPTISPVTPIPGNYYLPMIVR